jgi:hypothetical protein
MIIVTIGKVRWTNRFYSLSLMKICSPELKTYYAFKCLPLSADFVIMVFLCQYLSLTVLTDVQFNLG